MCGSRTGCIPWDATRMWAGMRCSPSSAPEYKVLRQFRAQFIECLELAMAAYPDANVSVNENGITLRPSRPAVTKAS